MTRRTMNGRVASAAIALAGIALVAACGGSSTADTVSSTSQSATAHNAADVGFATDMIPHHAQAIKGAQAPEIAAMSGWLKEWKVPVPNTSMGHSMNGGSGMMSADEMAALDKATGVAFDRMWVDMMTRHHKGAIEMAKAELKDGQFAAAKALAQQIVTSQTGEVATMATIAKRVG